MRGANANANNANASKYNGGFKKLWGVVYNYNQKLELLSPQESTTSLAGTKKGVQVL